MTVKKRQARIIRGEIATEVRLGTIVVALIVQSRSVFLVRVQENRIRLRKFLPLIVQWSTPIIARELAPESLGDNFIGLARRGQVARRGPENG